MNDETIVTGAAVVLAGMGIVSSISPAAGAWLDWAMGWVLGISLGGPLAIWAVRETAAEILLAREVTRSHRRPDEPLR